MRRVFLPGTRPGHPSFHQVLRNSVHGGRHQPVHAYHFHPRSVCDARRQPLVRGGTLFSSPVSRVPCASGACCVGRAQPPLRGGDMCELRHAEGDCGRAVSRGLAVTVRNFLSSRARRWEVRVQYGMVRSLSIEVSHIIATNLRGTKVRRRTPLSSLTPLSSQASRTANTSRLCLQRRGRASTRCFCPDATAHRIPPAPHPRRRVSPSLLLRDRRWLVPSDPSQGAKGPEEVEEASEQNKRAREEIIRRAPSALRTPPGHPSWAPQPLRSPPVASPAAQLSAPSLAPSLTRVVHPAQPSAGI